MAGDNRTLGRFMLDGILPAPRGVPQVEVAFEIDANGILNVSARDKGTGKEQKITITASSGLNKDEVDKMRHDAEEYASDDVQRKEEAETRNAADSLAYTAEKTLREHGDKLPEDVKQEIESKTAAVRSAIEGKDVTAIKSAMQELSDAVQKAGAAVYGQPGQPGQPGAAEGPAAEEPGADDGTVEGDFREV